VTIPLPVQNLYDQKTAFVSKGGFVLKIAAAKTRSHIKVVVFCAIGGMLLGHPFAPAAPGPRRHPRSNSSSQLLS
jgi:hypothetical protein